MIGSVIQDRFRIEKFLGEGGMGIVYSAYELRLKRLVALKLLRPEYAENEQMVQRFLVEATAQANIVHPNITTIHDQFTWEGRPIIVMELLDGETFASMIARRGPIPAHLCLPWVIDALAGLEAAHQRGIVHRDLKPANLMMTKTNVVKVMDFGIARMEQTPGLTRTAAALGTPYYMSPEQIDRSRFGLKTIDFRADIYAMGVTLYELLAGEVPFHGDSEYAIQRAHLEERPEPPTARYPYIPDSVVAAVYKAMAKNPADRFASAATFSSQLKLCLPEARRMGGVTEADIRVSIELPVEFPRATVNETVSKSSEAAGPLTQPENIFSSNQSGNQSQSVTTPETPTHLDPIIIPFPDVTMPVGSDAIAQPPEGNRLDALLARCFGRAGHPRLIGATVSLLVVAGIGGLGVSSWYEARTHVATGSPSEDTRFLSSGGGSTESNIHDQKRQDEPIRDSPKNGKSTEPSADDTKKPAAGNNLPEQSLNLPPKTSRTPAPQPSPASATVVAGSWSGSIQTCDERTLTPATLRIYESPSASENRLVITGQLRLGNANCHMAGSYDRTKNRMVLQALSCSAGAPDFLSHANSSILSLQHSELSGAVSPSCAIVKLSRAGQ
jgi:serine/threonine protein kinase